MRILSRLAVSALTVVLLGGFDLSRHSVPPEEILGGGPPKDGIPALLKPKFVPASQATFLKDSDRVLGLEIKGDSRAYPLRILNWHEVVDDVVGAHPVAVTFCPLTQSGIVYSREQSPKKSAQPVSFGVSGKLYQSNLLMYDKDTESLWSQLGGQAIAGPLTGRRLRALNSVETTWGAWRRAHPDTLVLSPDTGFERDYTVDPYANYERTEEVMFPVSPLDKRLPPKEFVLGVATPKGSAAFVLSKLIAQPKGAHLRMAGSEVTARYDLASRSAVVRLDGKPAVAIKTYWFAWAAFHPDTKLWPPPAQTSGISPHARHAKAPDSGVYGFAGFASGGGKRLGIIGDCVTIYDARQKRKVATGYCFEVHPGKFRIPLAPGRYILKGPAGTQSVEVRKNSWARVDSVLKLATSLSP